MIKLELRDEYSQLKGDPKVEAWLKKCEKVLNKELPDSKLQELKKEIAFCMSIGMVYTLNLPDA